MLAGDKMVEILVEWGVEYIFGMPGDSINSLMESIRKEKRIQFIQVRYEEVGALTAEAYAKLTGKLGVCMAIAGPGAIHLLNALYDAKLDLSAGTSHNRPSGNRLAGYGFFSGSEFASFI